MNHVYSENATRHRYIWHCTETCRSPGCSPHTNACQSLRFDVDLNSNNQSEPLTWFGSCGSTTYTFSLTEYYSRNASCSWGQQLRYVLTMNGQTLLQKSGCWGNLRLSKKMVASTLCGPTETSSTICAKQWFSVDEYSSGQKLQLNLITAFLVLLGVIIFVGELVL